MLLLADHEDSASHAEIRHRLFSLKPPLKHAQDGLFASEASFSLCSGFWVEVFVRVCVGGDSFEKRLLLSSWPRQTNNKARRRREAQSTLSFRAIGVEGDVGKVRRDIRPGAKKDVLLHFAHVGCGFFRLDEGSPTLNLNHSFERVPRDS